MNYLQKTRLVSWSLEQDLLISYQNPPSFYSIKEFPPTDAASCASNQRSRGGIVRGDVRLKPFGDGRGYSFPYGHYRGGGFGAHSNEQFDNSEGDGIGSGAGLDHTGFGCSDNIFSKRIIWIRPQDNKW
jgi:hypothetical protein